MKRILRFDWDIIAGIAAAVVAIVLHLLHVVHTGVLLTIVLVLLALLLIRDLRREGQDEQLAESLDHIRGTVKEVHLSLTPPDAILIGPRQLRSESRRFVESASGEMIWFNVCFLMFQSQELFDLLLKPAIGNPHVTSVQFVSDDGERELWQANMKPKIEACARGEKIAEPRWRQLPKTVSFILADVGPEGATEALLSFWGEPFMARTTGQQVPRYVFRVQAHSELVPQLVELERQHRMSHSEHRDED